MEKKNGHLANGMLLSKHLFDVKYKNNYYKKIDDSWFIFGNLALYPITNENKIMELEIELMIVKSKGE